MQAGSTPVQLAYGREGLTVELPEHAELLVADYPEPLSAPREALCEALRSPIGSPPLVELARSSRAVAIVTSDITRPVPNQLLLEVLLDELERAGCDPSLVTVINGTGLHRPGTDAELLEMYGPRVMQSCRVINHDARDDSELESVGRDPRGVEILINRAFVAADLRIVTGFIEPHLFAGFSGGGKGVMPGIAGRQTVLSNHSAAQIADPRATFGQDRGNPVFEEMRRAAELAGTSFLLDVTLDRQRQITGVFGGELCAAHDAGIELVRRHATVEVSQPFDLLVTTNGGYPADLNLYQAIKGLAAAAPAAAPGAPIVLAAECSEGVGHDSYVELLARHDTPRRLLEALSRRPEETRDDQWQAQIQAGVMLRHPVWLYSSLEPRAVGRAHLAVCADVAQTVGRLAAELEQTLEERPRIGVLADGQQVILSAAGPEGDGAARHEAPGR